MTRAITSADSPGPSNHLRLGSLRNQINWRLRVLAVLLDDQRLGGGKVAHAVQQLEGLPVDQSAKRPGGLWHTAIEQSLHLVHEAARKLLLHTAVDAFRGQRCRQVARRSGTTVQKSSGAFVAAKCAVSGRPVRR